MNKVMGIIALLALTGNIASAELLKNFKYDGKIEAVGVTVNNANDLNKNVNDKFGDVKTRVVINTGFDLNEDANAVVTFVKNNRNYGSGSDTVTDANGNSSNGGILDNLFVEQAYVGLKGVFGIDHKVGRQFYGNNGDINIYFGPQDWYVRGLAVDALDGWTGSWNKDKWSASAMMAKAAEFGGVANRDADIYGVNAAYDYSEIVKPAAYYYDLKDRRSAARLNDLQTVGVKANGEYKGVKYGAEYAMNMGTNHNLTSTTNMDYKGYAVKANAAYGIDLAGKLGFDAEFAMGSGDKKVTDKSDKSFRDINANYRPGLILGGIGLNNGVMVVDSLNNLTTYNVGANWTPSKVEKLNLAVKYYDFSYTEKVGTVEHLGTEADLVATWNHSDNLSLKLGLAMFMPDEYKIGGKDDSATLGTLAMNVKF